MSSPPKPSSSRPTTNAPASKTPPSSTTSSIDKNSSEDDEDATTVASEQGDQLSLSVNVLEDALPTKKGLSEHHSGKQKSYTNLADAEEDSSIVKPDDSYSKKRKNKLARELYIGGLGREPVNKKLTNESRSTDPPSATNVASGTGSKEPCPDSSSSGEEKIGTTSE